MEKEGEVEEVVKGEYLKFRVTKMEAIYVVTNFIAKRVCFSRIS